VRARTSNIKLELNELAATRPLDGTNEHLLQVSRTRWIDDRGETGDDSTAAAEREGEQTGATMRSCRYGDSHRRVR
jgi:hypothetical protein